MTHISAQNRRTLSVVFLTLAACLIYAISSGIRSNYGIMLGSISANSGISYSSVSFILAVGQLVFGIMQPVFGIVALKRSNAFVLCCGTLLTAAGLLLIPFCHAVWPLLLFLGFVLPSGTGALSFGIVMGAITPKLPEKHTSAVSGLVNASNGLGSSLLSPIIQALTAAAGLLGAMLFLSVPTLLLLPVSLWLCRSGGTPGDTPRAAAAPAPLGPMFHEALRSHSYRFLMIGFFTCGFHMAIVETHLFTQVTTYGFSDQVASYAFFFYGAFGVIGSVLSGFLCGKFSMPRVLSALYGLRAVCVILFLFLPKTALVIFGFAAALGITGNSTVVPTSGLVGRTFGAAKLATLFGLVFFAHQIGSFFSAWLGGICVTATGGYTLIWCVDILFCVLAAVVSCLIQERH